jgi:phage shock protein A
MFKFFKRVWRYMTAAVSGKFEEVADPKVQLEQAIGEAQDQHRRLTEQAANVIANQKQTEMRLNRSMEELERMNGSTKQALLMADEAQRRGDTAKAAEYNQAAEGFANRLISVEKQVDDLKTMHLQTTQASDQAKAAVQQNSAALQKKLADRQKLLGQLDQAKMQEQMNKAMATLSETVGQDVPTFDQVRDKIEQRYARAIGTSELQGQTVESRMLEVEQASLNTEAKSRLSELRSQLGLSAGAQGELAGAPQQAVPAAGETGGDAVPSAAQTPVETPASPAEAETPRSGS